MKMSIKPATKGVEMGLSTPIVATSTVTNDYEKLTNKPSIENVELVGNKTFEQLGYGIASFTDIDHILYG